MFRLCTFGSVGLEDADGHALDPVLAQPKRLALLVFLAAARPAGVHRRDRLLALFWPDLDEARARDALNQALRFLRQALGTETVVSRGAEEVGIDPARLWCDAVAFRDGLEGGSTDEALELYRGEFLQGFFIEDGGGFEEWMEGERAALRDSAARGARQLADQLAADGSLTLAMSWGKRALELAPDDERALRRLLRLHDRAGDRAGAFRLYEAFARRFEEEFGGEPSAETRALVEQLKSGRPLEEERGGPARGVVESPRPAARDFASELSDRYRIVRKLGAGGMAIVYLAEDVKHDREVALKVLRPEVAEGLARERFVREIRIASRLQHPNIVPLFDSGIVGERPFYVMAHIEGETLRERLLREGRFSCDEVRHVLREVAGALAYAHERGVIHRDIKPENILLIDRRAVLADFGIARAAHFARTPADSFDATLTVPGTSLGTPAYMAPEQAAGSPEVDGRADLYALGVLGYEMLAGRPPFVGHSAQEILAAQLTRAPVPIGELRPDTPAGLGALLMRCLEKPPAQRPGSALELLRDLEAQDSAGPSRVASLQPALSGRSRRGRRALLAVGGLLLIGGLGLTVYQIRKGSRAESAESPGLPAGIEVLPPRDPRRIAVLYFDDLTPTKTLGHVAHGLTEDLIDALSRIRGLQVISPNGVRPFQTKVSSVDSLSKELGVGTLVTGSVAASRGPLRVTVRLIDGISGRQLESRTVEQPWDDVLALRDTLGVEVTQFLRVRLGREIRLREERAGTRSVRAWELAQQAEETAREGAALAALDDPVAAVELLERADASLRRAEELDTSWVVPILRRARVALTLAFVSPGPASASDSNLKLGAEALKRSRLSPNWLLQALALTGKALARQPRSAEALALRGELRHRLVALAFPPGPDSLLPLAKADLRDALDARPELARAWNVLGQLLRGEGRYEEAAQAARNAFEADAYLDDAQAVLNDIFFGALYLERPDQARSWCRMGLQRFPSNANFAQCQLTLLGWFAKGRRQVDTAWRLLGEIERRDSLGVLSPMWGYRRMLVATVLARSGLGDSARAVIQRVKRGGPDHPGSSDVTDIEAYVRLQLGERDAAVSLLEAYLQARPSARAYVARNPWYRGLHTDQRFRALVGFPG